MDIILMRNKKVNFIIIFNSLKNGLNRLLMILIELLLSVKIELRTIKNIDR